MDYVIAKLIKVLYEQLFFLIFLYKKVNIFLIII